MIKTKYDFLDPRCCVPAQIPYLLKFLFLRYGQNLLSQSDRRILLINNISRTNQWHSVIFLHVDANPQKLKVDHFWGVDMLKNGCEQYGHRTLKLAVLHKWIDGMKWFFACWCKFRKDKIWFNDFGWAWSKMGMAFLFMKP